MLYLIKMRKHFYLICTKFIENKRSYCIDIHRSMELFYLDVSSLFVNCICFCRQANFVFYL